MDSWTSFLLPGDVLGDGKFPEWHSIIGEEMRFTSLYYDHIKEVPPASTDHVGHPLVYSLKWRICDNKQLLPFLRQFLQIRYQQRISVKIKLGVGSCFSVECCMRHPDTSGDVIMKTLWLILQTIAMKIIHDSCHQTCLRFGKYIHQLDH